MLALSGHVKALRSNGSSMQKCPGADAYASKNHAAETVLNLSRQLHLYNTWSDSTKPRVSGQYKDNVSSV